MTSREKNINFLTALSESSMKTEPRFCCVYFVPLDNCIYHVIHDLFMEKRRTFFMYTLQFFQSCVYLGINSQILCLSTIEINKDRGQFPFVNTKLAFYVNIVFKWTPRAFMCLIHTCLLHLYNGEYINICNCAIEDFLDWLTGFLPIHTCWTAKRDI